MYKRFLITITFLILICILTILNIPKKPIQTTTLGATGSSNISITTQTTTKSTKKKTEKTKNINEISAYLYEKVIEKGWTDNDYNAIVNIIIKESNFNVNSVNKSSGACGLFQAYPCNKMKKYGKDYKTNYKVQIAFGIDYISKRYGTPEKAWNYWKEHRWY